jgi:tetratricopeptide (TPR) repeat protein
VTQRDDPADGFGQRLKAAAGPEDDVDARKWRAEVASRLFGAPAATIRIGRFEVVRRIGEGAAGVVYEAHDPKLERRVAIKLLRPEACLAAREAADALAREAKTLAKLSHPNVVPVYDVGTHDQQVFIALEYVAGCTMRQWMAQPHTEAEIIEVFVQAGQGLAAAHAAGLVHRDFKPENVLIGDDGRVRVSDFGIAHTLDGDAIAEDIEGGGETSQDLSPGRDVATHRGAGTPSYMAPEQFLGDPVDARTDQFGFCVALHEALYRERPFAGSSRSALAANVIAGRRRAPPAGVRVSARLDRLVARGLSLRPDDRFVSMEVLVERLQRRPNKRRLAIGLAFVAGVAATAIVVSPESDDPPTPCADAQSQLQMVWSAKRAEAFRAAFVATELPYAADTATRVTASLDEYGARWQAAYGEACEGQTDEVVLRRLHCLQSRLLEFDSLLGELSTADRAAIEHAVTGVAALTDPRECEHVGETTVAAAPAPPTPQMTQLRQQIAAAKAKHDAGRPREALPLARDAARRAQDLGDPTLSAEALLVTGQTERSLLGMIARNEAQASVYGAVLAAQAAARPDLEARAMVEYLGVNESLGELDRVLEWAPRVRAAVARIGDPPELRGKIDYTLAMVHSFRGDADLATIHAQASLDTFMQGGRATRRWAASSHNLLGELVFGTGDYAAALPHYERALDITLEEMGPAHPWAANGYGNMAEVYHYLGRYRESDDLFRHSFQVRLDSYGPTSIWVIHSMAHVADTALLLGEPERARDIYAQALEQRDALRALVGDKPEGDVVLSVYRDIQAWDQDQWLHHGLALAYLQLGDLEQAQAHATAIEEPVMADDPHHPDQIPRIDVLGWVRLAQSRPADAAAEFRRAVSTLEAVYPATHYVPAFAISGLGQAELALGQTDAAITDLRAALLRFEHTPAAFPRQAGETRRALADALWATGETQEALALAAAAHDDFRRALDLPPGELAELEAWLAAHDPAAAPTADG